LRSPPASGCVSFSSVPAGKVRESRGADGLLFSRAGEEARARRGTAVGTEALREAPEDALSREEKCEGSSEKTRQERSELAAVLRDTHFPGAQKAPSGRYAALRAKTPRIVESPARNPTNRFVSFSCDGNECNVQDGHRQGRSLRRRGATGHAEPRPFTTFP
jgi:hypothetical protein